MMLPLHFNSIQFNSTLLNSILISISIQRYATFAVLAGADPSNSVMIGGALRPVDSVDVWPMLTGVNTTHPRPITPTSEAGIVDTAPAGAGGEGKWYKLVTLAGQSVYYSETANQTDGTDACLKARQPDPPQPGRTDPIVNGCPVCNATSPCLYEILSDPSEKINVASSHPDVVATLAPLLAMYNDAYVTGRIGGAARQRLQAYQYITVARVPRSLLRARLSLEVVFFHICTHMTMYVSYNLIFFGSVNKERLFESNCI